MGSVLYALRDEFTGTVEQDLGDETVTVDLYQGGVLNLGKRSGDLDVKAALEEGGGTIAVADNDGGAIGVLDAYPPLKRVGTSEDTGGGYNDETVKALAADAKARGIAGGSKATKDELVDALEFHDRIRSGQVDPDSVELPDPPTVAALAEAADPEEG